MFLDKFGDLRGYQRTPAFTTKDTVMPRTGNLVVFVALRGNARAELMGRLGLANARDVVEFALDGEQGCLANILGPYPAAFDIP